MRALMSLMLLALAGNLASAEIRGAASLAAPLENQGVDARSLGMGSALMGLGGGSESLLWNPAGLSRLRGGDVALHHHSWVADITQETLTSALPLGSLGGVGLGLGYVGFGSFESRDSQGALIGNFEARRLNVAAGWGRQLMPSFSMGLGARYNRQDMGPASFNGYAFDAGLIYEPAKRVSLALAYANAGVTDLGAGLASGLRAAAAYDADLGGGSKMLAALSSLIEPGGVSKLQLGAEGSLEGKYFLRAGYQFRLADNQLSGLQGVSLGLGAEMGLVRLDYAWLPYGELGSSQRLSLSYLFSAVPQKTEIKLKKKQGKVQPRPKTGSITK